MNIKLQEVELDLDNLVEIKPINSITCVRGTEKGHWYMQRFEKGGLKVHARYLCESVTTDVVIKDGPEARIRIIETGEKKANIPLLLALGFTKKGSSPNVHYSRVTNDAATLLEVLLLGLNF